MSVVSKVALGTFIFASSAYGNIWPIGETCDNPGTYRACENAGLTCNDQTAVCEGSSDAILGRTCDIPTNYNFCEAAGYSCNALTAICEERSENTIFSDDINIRLYPGNTYSKTVLFGSRTFIRYVDVISDWWMKRPTEIRVYNVVDGEKGPILGEQQFNSYDANICGPSYNSRCSYPEATNSRLSIEFEGELINGIVIEVDGLLSEQNQFSMIKKIEIRS